MKKLIYLSAAVAALFAFSACTKENISPAPEVEGKTVNIRFSAANAGDTKTGVTYDDEGKKHTPYWNKGDKIGVFFDGFSDKSNVDAVLANANETGKTASFDAEGVSLNNGTEPGSEGMVYSFYPASAFHAVVAKDNAVRVNLKQNQEPAAVGTYDPEADILVGKPSDYLFDTFDNSFVAEIPFARVMSVVKITLKAGNECPENLAVNKFTMTAPEGTVLTGRVTLSLDEITSDNSPLGEWTVKNATVSAVYDDVKPVIGDEEAKTVYLIVNPTKIESGEDVIFTIDTDDYTIEKTVPLSNALAFPQGNVANIGLTIAGANCTPKVAETRIWVDNFEKCTVNKTKYEISQTGAKGTGLNENTSYDYGTGDIRINNNGHSSSDPYLYVPSGNTFTVKNLSVSEETALILSAQTKNAGTVTLKCKESTAEEWTEIGSWTSTGSFSEQKTIFNIASTATSIDLSFTASAPIIIDDIVLEKFVDQRTTLAVPANVKAEADANTSNKINVTWDAVENAGSYEVTLSTEGEEDVVEEAATNSISFTGLKYSTQYSVKVKAISSDVTSYKDSEYSEPVNVTTGEKPAVQIDWVKKAVADILPTDEVVLVGNSTNSLNSTAVSSNPARVVVTVSNGKLTSEVSDDMKWNLVGNTTDGFILYANGTTDRYLYCNTTAVSGSNTCIRVGKSTSTTIRNLWTIDGDGYMITKDLSPKRYLSVYDNTDWRGYVNTSNGAQKVEFYVKDDPRTVLATPEITVTPDNTAKKITVSWEVVAYAKDYTVTCTGQEAKTATINTCEFTDLAYGDYTITVQANPADETTYKPSAKASENVSIVDTTPAITASNPAAVEADVTSVEVPYTVTNKVTGTNLTAAVTTGNWISNPQVAADKVTFTLSANTTSEQRTGTVTLSYAGAADKVITITQKGAGQAGYASLEELVAAGEPTTETSVTVTFSNKVITKFQGTGTGRKGLYVSVQGAYNNEVEIYCGSTATPTDWIVGGWISGTLTDCTWKKYNSTWELCPSNWNDINYAGPVAKPEIALDGANATITCATAGATILYEISDTEPANFTHTYSSPVALTDGQTIWAKATLAGHPDSEVASKKYTAGGGDEPTVLTFDLSSNPGGWPTTNSTTLTNYTYTLDKTDYTFGLNNVKCNSGYLMLTKTAVLGLPAIEGKKLTKVVAKNSSGCSTTTNVGISSSSSSASYISGGAIQTWSTTSSTYTYTLTGTSNNTVYYLYVTNKNAQIIELTLTYE